jgi:hypothetical protein
LGGGPALVAASTNSKEAVLGQASGTGQGIHGVTTGTGNAGVFESTNSGNANPVQAVTNRGVGYAAVFLAATASGKGVLVQTSPGQPGLHVVNGTKNAVVATPAGAKALYTEES